MLSSEPNIPKGPEYNPFILKFGILYEPPRIKTNRAACVHSKGDLPRHIACRPRKGFDQSGHITSLNNRSYAYEGSLSPLSYPLSAQGRGSDPVADPLRVQGVCLNPPPCPGFQISYENEIIWSQTKLFHFYGIFKKNEANPPYINTYEPLSRNLGSAPVTN